MRDLFDNNQPDNPIEAARRGARPALRSRFYQKAAAARAADGHIVSLDGKPIRTPARHVLAAPTLPLAQAIAAEWEAQGETIDPATMPLTRLANAIIDSVVERAGAVSAEVAKYLATDLVCYRASLPEAWSSGRRIIGIRSLTGRATNSARAFVSARASAT